MYSMTDFETKDFIKKGPLYKMLEGSTLPKSSPFDFKKSALTGKRTINILEQAKFINEEYHKKITTGLLNQILSEMIAQNPVPTRKGRAVKINYATQVSEAPPKFVFFSNNPELVHFSYQRYIENKLREYFGFEGCPIDIVFNKKNESY